MPALTVDQLAALCDGTAEGDTSIALDSVNALEEADHTQLSFVATRKAAAKAQASKAGCLIVPIDFDNPGGRTLIRVKDPRAAFARAAKRLHPEPRPTPGIHPSAMAAPSAKVGADCFIGPHVAIGEDVIIGPECYVHAGSVIGDGVILGKSCVLHPNVTIYRGVCVGDRVILHAGCVIGADGFGFAFYEGRYEKFPQIGTVEIGDDVELGANTCVDRAALGVTRIGNGTKLDNMVHVAHNCRIGSHVVIAAQTGFSGGVTVGDYAVVGGQVGVGDKATIQSGAVVGSGAGILTSKIVRPGEPVWGTPARPLRMHLQQLAAISRIPALLEEIGELKKRLEALEQR